MSAVLELYHPSVCTLSLGNPWIPPLDPTLGKCSHAVIHIAQNILIDLGAIWFSSHPQSQFGICVATCKPSIGTSLESVSCVLAIVQQMTWDNEGYGQSHTLYPFVGSHLIFASMKPSLFLGCSVNVWILYGQVKGQHIKVINTANRKNNHTLSYDTTLESVVFLGGLAQCPPQQQIWPFSRQSCQT
jgi:hypothetical protein